MHEVQQYHSKDESPPNRTPCPGRTSGAFECGGSHATMGARGARVNVSRDAHQSRTLLARRARSHPRGAVATSGPRSARPGRGGSRVDRRPAVGLLPRGSFSGLPKALKYAPTYCLGRYAFPRVLVLGMVRGHQKPLS